MSQLAALAAWSILPNLIANAVHAVLLKTFPHLMSHARAGTLRHNKQRQWIYVGIIITYLAHNLYQVSTSRGSNFYQLLGILPYTAADERVLRTAFRRMSALHHPDRPTGDDGQFRLVRSAYDTLSDPVRRFAYDRFGPSTLRWSIAADRSAVLRRGLRECVPWYVGTFLIIFGLGWLRSTSGQTFYWRTLIFVGLAALHYSSVAGCTMLPWLDLPFERSRALFETIEIAQSLTSTALVAIGQIGPVLSSLANQELGESYHLGELGSLAYIAAMEAEQTKQLQRRPPEKM
ncbi:hypothetical protein PYCC9005_000293 [Savitreella phatthalungensis]